MARLSWYSLAIPQAKIIEGDPLQVKDDGFDFETDAGFKVNFFVTDVTDITASDLGHFALPHIVPALPSDPEFNNPDASDKFVEKGRFRWYLDLYKMPIQIRDELRNFGKLNTPLTIAQINEYVVDRYLNETLISV